MLKRSWHYFPVYFMLDKFCKIIANHIFISLCISPLQTFYLFSFAFPRKKKKNILLFFDSCAIPLGIKKVGYRKGMVKASLRPSYEISIEALIYSLNYRCYRWFIKKKSLMSTIPPFWKISYMPPFLRWKKDAKHAPLVCGKLIRRRRREGEDG